MAVFKATSKKKTSNTGSVSSAGTFKATKRKTYDTDIVSKWESDNEESIGVLNQYRERIENNEWLSPEDLSTYRSALDTYIDTSTSLRSIGKSFGNGYSDEDNKAWEDSIVSMNTGYDEMSKHYSKYSSADSYTKAMQDAARQQEEYEAMMSADLDALQAEIDDYTARLPEATKLYKERQELKTSMSIIGNRPNGINTGAYKEKAARLKEVNARLSEIGLPDDIRATLSEKQAWFNTATRLRGWQALSDVGNPESEKYDPEFDAISAEGAATPYYEEFGTKEYKYVSHGTGAYEIDDYRAAAVALYEHQGNATPEGYENFINIDKYRRMDDTQFATLAYYLEKDSRDGTNLAEQYLDSIEENLNYQEATERFSGLEDKWALELLFGVEAGLDQFASGLDSLFSDKDYIPVTSTQMTSQMVREDLGDSDFKILGSTVAQIGYDEITTTSNMLPSILVSAAVNVAAPGAGAPVGAVLLGASAAGNAYQEMLNLGYDKGQARAYGLMVGASEAGLQYLLGGVGSLAGGPLKSLGAKALSKIDNALARAALTLGKEMLSEGVEEGLQTALEPWFKSLATGVDFDSPTIDEVLYSTLLGALSSAGIGGVTTVAKSAIGTMQANANAKALFGGQQQDLVAEGVELGGAASELANQYQSMLDKGKNLTGAQLRKLVGSNEQGYRTNDTAKIASAAEARLTALGETGDVKALASILAKQVAGETLSRSEKAMLEGSAVAGAVADELSREKMQSRGHTMEWVRDIGTKRINADVYNLAREVAGVTATEDAATPEGKAKVLTADTSEKEVEKSKFDYSEDGKTTYNGKEVSIKGIDSIVDGNVTLLLESGEKVNAKDVKLGSHSEALVYEAVTRMGASAETANVILENIGSVDLESIPDYVGDSVLAYRYGTINNKRELADLKIPDAQKELLYERGRRDAETRAEQKKPKLATKKTAETKPKKNGVFYEDTTIYNEETASPIQKESIGRIEELAKLAPSIEFHVYSSKNNGDGRVAVIDGVEVEAAPNGYFTDGNKVYIDLNAGNKGEGVMLYTASHEIGHFIRRQNAKAFKAIGDFLIEQYGERGVPVAKLIEAQKKKIIERYKRDGKALPSEAKLFDMAYEELVCDAMSTMLASPTAFEKLQALKAKNKTAFQVLGDAIKAFLRKVKTLFTTYRNKNPDAKEAQHVMDFAPDVYAKLQDLYLKAFVEADANYESFDGEETDLDGDESDHLMSDRSIVEGAGLQFILNEDGVNYTVLDSDGNRVKSVTAEMIVDSPLGNLVTMAKEQGFLGKGKEADAAADKQYGFLAELVNMCIRYDGIAPIWETAGTMVFSSMKSNADKQYGLTVDFSTVCKKTQAIVDAMSEAMLRLGRGLTRSEVEAIYLEVGKAGESTPCPVCYVFSRWMGIGGILDQISRFQDKYTTMSEKSVQEFMADIEQRIHDRAYTPGKTGKLKAEFFNKNGEIATGKVITDLKAKANSKAASALKAIAKNANTQLQIQELEALMENQTEKEAKKTAGKIAKLKKSLKDVSSLEKQMTEANDTVEEYEAYQWLTRTLMMESDGKWVKNDKFKPVPKDILFDLNKGDKFAEGYPLSWAFRTGKGASAGKAIVPYADARVGEAIQSVAAGSPKDIKIGLELNPFLNADKNGRERILRSAIEKQRRQNLLGGQRYQSTSDFRYEYGSDYLITFLEMQAIGAKVQLYTKVIEAVDFLASMGADCNLSVMPLSDGFVVLPDGTKKLVYSSVTGINAEAAIKKAHEYNNVQLILVGISDEHIRLALEGLDITFVIPFHGSGNSVHQIQALMNLLGENLDVTTAQDYTAVQSDHVSPKQTKEQKAMWDLRVKIVKGEAAVITAAEHALLDKNPFLKDLYRRFYLDTNAEEFGVGLTSDQAEQIFPYEYWDKSLTYDEADQNGERFKEYCATMGIIPRFSGKDSKGVDVGYGDFSNDKGYWKLLIDRPMYDNTYDSDGNWTGYGKYHEQARINCSNFQVKHLDPEYGSATYGDVMSKENDPKKTNKIVDAALKQFENNEVNDVRLHSDRDSTETATQFLGHMDGIVKTKGHWYATDVYDYIAEHPELNFIERIYAGDKSAKKDLETFLAGISDVRTLMNLYDYMQYAYMPKGETFDENYTIVHPYRGAVRTFYNAVNRRINAIGAEINGGTNLGIKNGEVTLDYIEDLFNRLNTNGEIGEFSKKVFATARLLGVNIRFVNQMIGTPKKGKIIGGQAWGDMVQYKTSYFNNAGYSDQTKAKTLLHEMIHICTVYVMNENVSAGDVRWRGRSENYNRIANAATRLNRIYGQINGDPDFKGQYGLLNSKEMVAELANEKFVGLMKKKSLWGQIVDWICDLFGFRRGTSAYDNARMCVDFILDNPEVEEYKRHAIDQRQAYRRTGGQVFGSTTDTDGTVYYSDRDSDYLSAVERGDMETAQRMVDEAAKKAGYTVAAYHGTHAKFNSFDISKTRFGNSGYGFYFGDQWKAAEYGGDSIIRAYLKAGRIATHKDNKITAKQFLSAISRLGLDPKATYKRYVDTAAEYVSKQNDWKIAYSLQDWARNPQFYGKVKSRSIDPAEILSVLQETLGIDGIANDRETVIWDNTLIKSADPVTYDDDGNIIPLSKRFNAEESDIRYSDRDYSEGLSEADKATADTVVKNLRRDKMSAKYGRHFGAFTEERIAKEIRHSSSDTETDYAKSYIAWVRPDDFVRATTATEAQRERLRAEAGVLDAERLANYDQPIYLDVDFETGEIRGHEGRHRMLALQAAGIDKVAVIFDARNDDRKHTKPIEYMRLKGQRFGDGKGLDFSITNALPLSMRYADVASDVFSFDAKDGVRFSDRDNDSVSTRSLLANALESAAQNDIERRRLAEYKQKIALIEAEQAKLAEIRSQIRELSFAKGPRDTAKIKALQFDEKQAANRINTYDRQLLNLQSTTALKRVLEHEKKRAYKKAETEGKAALAKYREKAAATQRELLTRHQESRKKGIESRNKTEMRRKIKEIAKELDTLLRRPTKDKHIKEELRKPVAEALMAINLDTVDAESRVAHYNALIAKSTDPDVIAALTATRDRIQLQGDNLQEKFDALRVAYERIENSEDVELSMSYQLVIRNSIAKVAQDVGKTPIRNMTLEQLEAVYELYSMIRKTIRDANKRFKQGKTEGIMKTAEAVNDEVRKVGGKLHKQPRILANLKRIGWSLLKPLYAFRTIGSDTLLELYSNLQEGEGTFYGDVSAAQAFIEAQYEKHGFKSWDMKATKKFRAKSGKSFELTIEQMMSLYAYSRREQAHLHIIEGGIVFDEAVIVEKKHGIPISYEVTTKDAFNLSEETLTEIVDSLSAEQKAFVEEMQAYLSDTMGAKGNEVSMELLGVKLFKEQFYLPIVSSSFFMNFKPQEAGQIKLKNPSFSKETVQRANNPIVLYNFTDLWAEHVSNMSMYHAFVLALEDFTRVYNYKTRTGALVETMSTKQTIETAYTGATRYIENFLTSLNGGVRMDTVGFAEKFTTLTKKGAVMGSWSVFIQQPSAVMRAMAHINPVHFAATTHKSINLLSHKRDWEELKKYAPVAGIKEMGRFDVGMGKDTSDWIKSNGSVITKIDDVLGMGPAFMDEVTWVSIWNAVKRETLHKHKDLSPTSEAFLKIAGDRFTEVVSLTQVYDSVFSRSDLMRNKSWIAKALTAFMAEPTTTLNMLLDAWVQGKRTGSKKGFAKVMSATTGAVVASIVFNAALKSIVMAMRDDDEDESYLESYVEHFFGDLKDSLNPLTLIPLVKDVVSIFNGYDVDRMDMALFSDLKNAIDAFDSDTKTGYEKWAGLVGAVASFFGLPVKNVERDFRGFITTIFGDSEETTAGGLLNAMWEGWEGKSKSNGQQLYEAMLNGDAEQVERVKGRFKNQGAINSAIRKALRENDPRIKEAAEARLNGNSKEALRIANAIVGEGHFTRADVYAAVKAEYEALKED